MVWKLPWDKLVQKYGLNEVEEDRFKEYCEFNSVNIRMAMPMELERLYKLWVDHGGRDEEGAYDV